jgi:hypothetical protein
LTTQHSLCMPLPLPSSSCWCLQQHNDCHRRFFSCAWQQSPCGL